MMKKVKPFVFISTAMSLDGKISNTKKEQIEICSNDDYLMRWDDRIECDAIYIGANQLRLDDPKLNMKLGERCDAREELGKKREPAKVALVSNLKTIKDLINGDFFNTGGKIILFTTKQTTEDDKKFFEEKAEVIFVGEEKIDIVKTISILGEKGFEKIMVEGGGEIIASLLENKLLDELHIKVGNRILGGRDSVTLVEGNGLNIPIDIEFKEVVVEKNYLKLICKPKY